MYNISNTIGIIACYRFCKTILGLIPNNKLIHNFGNAKKCLMYVKKKMHCKIKQSISLKSSETSQIIWYQSVELLVGKK